ISTAIDHLIEALSAPSESSNSLNLKEFVVPLSLEVGRIIRGFGWASTFNFKRLKYEREKTVSGPPGVCHKPCRACEIERRPRGARPQRRQTTKGRHLLKPTQSQAIPLHPAQAIAHYIAHPCTHPKDSRT
ncbi:hypothetical protein, partial [Pseudomonas sp.]|uniref:hypothetical protein n=1 Tax=Pseudomonas sp. TaxID=306 RepID=UPI0031D28B94